MFGVFVRNADAIHRSASTRHEIVGQKNPPSRRVSFKGAGSPLSRG
ncbi:hypothetical protein [Lysobacter gummosus]